MNREYIAKNNCEKKDELNNCCKGSCQLKKQLDNEDQKEKQGGSNPTKEKYKTQLFCQDLFFFYKDLSRRSEKNKTTFMEPFTDPSFRSVFHPPETSVLI